MGERIVEFDEMKKYENNKDVLIIDVRDVNEVEATGRIGGSINIPLSELENALKRLNDEEFRKKYSVSKPNADVPIIFSCKIGGRAEKAMKIALDNGFSKAKFYKGSWNEWKEKMQEKAVKAQEKMQEKTVKAQEKLREKLK